MCELRVKDFGCRFNRDCESNEKDRRKDYRACNIDEAMYGLLPDDGLAVSNNCSYEILKFEL
jgi:hypothetical protein